MVDSCTSPAASTYALVTPEGSSYRTLTIVESGGGVVDHDGAFRFPDGTYAPACWGYVAAGGASGKYWIDPTGSSPFKVYCEMDTDGGGWTLVDNDVSTTGGFSVRELVALTMSSSASSTPLIGPFRGTPNRLSGIRLSGSLRPTFSK